MARLETTATGEKSVSTASGRLAFSFSGPVVPVLLFGGQVRIIGLRDSALEHVQDADIMLLSGNPAEFIVQFDRVAPFELVDRPDAYDSKVFYRRRSDRAQVT
jgi:hypothetical protein